MVMWRKGRPAQRPWSTRPSWTRRSSRDAEGLFDDYAEIVLQMGLVCMWSLGFYYMPLLAALEILLQMRVDAYGLVCDSQRRSAARGAVGSWGTLMDTMSLLAVFTNAGIIVYTTKSLEDWSSNEKLCAFFVVESNSYSPHEGFSPLVFDGHTDAARRDPESARSTSSTGTSIVDSKRCLRMTKMRSRA